MGGSRGPVLKFIDLATRLRDLYITMLIQKGDIATVPDRGVRRAED